MKITDVTCTVLTVPDCNASACDSAQDTIVVQVHTDDGLTGIGETDANPWVIKAMIEAPGSHIMSLGLRELIIGQDPTQPAAIWDRLYTFTAMTGRRGAGVCAIGALGHGGVGSLRKGYGKARVAIARRRAEGLRDALCQPAAFGKYARRLSP